VWKYKINASVFQSCVIELSTYTDQWKMGLAEVIAFRYRYPTKQIFEYIGTVIYETLINEYSKAVHVDTLVSVNRNILYILNLSICLCSFNQNSHLYTRNWSKYCTLTKIMIYLLTQFWRKVNKTATYNETIFNVFNRYIWGLCFWINIKYIY